MINDKSVEIFKDWLLQENEWWLFLDKKLNNFFAASLHCWIQIYYELVSVEILPKSPDIRRSFGHFLKKRCILDPGVLNFELGMDVRPEVSNTTL